MKTKKQKSFKREWTESACWIVSLTLVWGLILWQLTNLAIGVR